MPRRIVIHAGFHKTGTSTVQQALRCNRAALRPYLRSILKAGMTDLIHATRGYSTWRDTLSRDKIRRRFRALLEGLPPMPRRTLCLSAEELSGHMPGREGIPDYRAAPEIAADLAEIAAEAAPGAELILFYSTRDPDNWLRSAYWEHVKSSSLTAGLDDFATAHRGAADLDAMVDRIAGAVPCPVHRARIEDHADNPAAPLLLLCGVPSDIIAGLPPPPPVNERLPHSILSELLKANRTHTDREALRAAKAAILRAAEEKDR